MIAWLIVAAFAVLAVVFIFALGIAANRDDKWDEG